MADTFERSYILPERQEGVKQNYISLNGTWQFRYSPQSEWTAIQVPGEAVMQGYAIEHDKPFLYKKTFDIPKDYQGRRIILRFDGVYSLAHLLVNGKSVRTHQGGFTRWETDITNFVRPGETNTIVLEVIDPKDDISFGSGYAHHPIGGILRDVTLFALPTTHLYDVNIETMFGNSLKDAILQISCFSESNEPANVHCILTSPQGKNVKLQQSRFALKSGTNKQEWKIPVNSPILWEAEHPNLYKLTVITEKKGKEIYRFSRNIGFRQIEIKGRQMFINGNPVKLRGACRHDMHPTLGRSTTAALDSIDALMFKKANMNFVRTTHYPPSEKFLEYCDRYGIFVECETAVCFATTTREAGYSDRKSVDNPEYTDRYLSQLKEMVKTLRTHPSIIIWSIGNESKYGSNIFKSWEWIKSTDTTRPVIFSWPGWQRDDKPKVYDIISIHYPGIGGSLKQKGLPIKGFEAEDNKPALFDEWAHPACYTYETLQRDPNIREFWGQSLDLMWSNSFEVPGALGGAIWCYSDETFIIPEPKIGQAFWEKIKYDQKPQKIIGNCVGYGEWGIVDIWRRKKPEFWGAKKAYSPVRILSPRNIQEFTENEHISLPVYNRFNHTDLNEIKARYTYKGKQKMIILPSVVPHQKGTITIPAENWEKGESLWIEFFDKADCLIDKYCFTLGQTDTIPQIPMSKEYISVEETDSFFIIKGETFEIPFNKKNGLITDAKINGKTIIKQGPFLNQSNFLKASNKNPELKPFSINEKDWVKTRLDCSKHNNYADVKLSGVYKDTNVDFMIKIMTNGKMTIEYQATGIPNDLLFESGISFHIADNIDRIDWKRNGYWCNYPENSIAANEGSASILNEKYNKYREQPDKPWIFDTHDYFYWGDAGANCSKPLTRIAKGLKENIYYYTLISSNDTLSVISPDASVACRINRQTDNKLTLYINNRWDYPDIAWGNYCKRIKALPCKGEITLQLR